MSGKIWGILVPIILWVQNHVDNSKRMKGQTSRYSWWSLILICSCHRVHADSGWQFRQTNEEWEFMDKTQIMTWGPNRKEPVPMSVWNICQSVLRHSGAEVPYGVGAKRNCFANGVASKRTPAASGAGWVCLTSVSLLCCERRKLFLLSTAVLHIQRDDLLHFDILKGYCQTWRDCQTYVWVEKGRISCLMIQHI